MRRKSLSFSFELVSPLAISLTLLTAANAQTVDVGRKGFLAHCSGCHGDDGTGGGRGPKIVEIPMPRGVSKEAVRELILNGIAEEGMPAFKISTEEAERIAAYVMILKASPSDGSASTEPAPGDPIAGESFFTGKGNCLSCHMVQGRGNILGPDLSNLARRRRLEQIEQELTDPGSQSLRPALGETGTYRAVTVRLQNGEALRGLAKNESTFDLQLLGVDGKLHLLMKAQIAGITPEKSLMPKVQATPQERRDLLAYLSRLTVDPRIEVIPAAEMRSGIPFADIAHPKPGTWPTYNGNVSGNRFSPLDQIDTNNVGSLAPKWIFSIGAPKGEGPPKRGVGRWVALEGTPVVADGVMYMTSVNECFALDARTGREIWHYSRPRTPGLAGDAASGLNRGVAVLGDRVFMVSDNAHLFALHRLTGQLLWDVEMADSRQNYGATSAPLIVNDLVVSGHSGGDEGARGFLAAYKASTGERVWRFWTIPAPGEPGSETWVGPALEHGCASTWLTGSYDPDSGLLYWPTGNPCPDYNADQRKGDNLYSSSMLALDAKTGKLRWYYQFTPHDVHDWDATQPPLLIDTRFRGAQRKLLVQANRNGFFYVLDRINGEVLLAEKFVKNLTWSKGIGADGRPIPMPDAEPTPEGVKACPSVLGAANWPSTAYDSGTGLFYVMATEACNIYTKADEHWQAGESWFGGGAHGIAAESGGLYLRAIDVETGKIAWEVPQVGEGASRSGVLATAGGLVFFGDNTGAFVGVDAKTGKPVWHFNTGQTWKASPMTYMIDGKQYVGVAAGSTIMAFGLP
jgi:PQQ-dependent dehydrogenase (methanol/ethanol family)